jgi:CBS domain-containing protein
VSIGPDVSSIEAMVLMNEQQISAVAVVDGIGKIIGNFSVSEMRCVPCATRRGAWRRARRRLVTRMRRRPQPALRAPGMPRALTRVLPPR